MNCTDFERLIALDVEGDLPQSKGHVVSEHMRVCPRCQEFAERLRASQVLLKGLGEEAVDEAALQEVRRRVRAQLATESEPRGNLVRRFAFGAGGIAALILAALILRPLLWKPVPQSVATRRTPTSMASVTPTPTLPGSLLPQTGKRMSVRQRGPSSPGSLHTNAGEYRPEPLTVKVLTDNPNVVIYWLVD